MNYMRIYENYGRIDLFRDNHHKQREREREQWIGLFFNDNWLERDPLNNELVCSLMIID